MKLTEVLAQHFYEVNYGDNWTDAAVKDVLQGISWKQAVKKVGDVNTIALLLFHMDFYNLVVYDRIVGVKRQFDHEDSLEVSISSEKDWLQLQETYFSNVDKIYTAIMAFDEDKLFEKKTVNTPYKNIHGLVEHIHYHLGQISLLKKLTK
ncbi:MAG: DinB family protein [Chitinophagaceae bacterium]|jgi:hypothetical protein|nr:DinB family protein [Chitinophagaceae bacterium]